MSSIQDRQKISIYMKLWELFNRSASLREFEITIINSIYRSSRYKHQHVDEVVKDFFSVNGIELTIHCNDDASCFKKNIITTSDNIYINFITKHFEDPRKFLVRVPKKSNLFYFESEQVNKILSYIEDASLSNSEKQVIVKSSLRNILGLKDRDAIFFVNDKLFVRFFIEKVSKACEKRFNGIPEDEMEKVLKRFKDINYEGLVENIAENIISKFLSPKTTDNITFHQKLIPYFQRSLSSVFKNYITEKELLVGFTNYVLRQHFNAGLYYIANSIIELVATKDSAVKKFISFYDGGEYRNKDKKVKKSEIIVDGDRWSFPPIYNIVAQKISLENQFFAKEDEISRLRNAMDEDSNTIEVVSKDLDDARFDLETIKQDAEKNLKKITDLRKKFQKQQVEEKKSKKEKRDSSEDLKAKIKESLEDDKVLVSQREILEKSINSMVIKRIDLEKRVDGARQKISSEMEKTVAIKSDYMQTKNKLDDIIKAFATTLMTFKL